MIRSAGIPSPRSRRFPSKRPVMPPGGDHPPAARPPDPQDALLAAVRAGDGPGAEAALAAGADPRCRVPRQRDLPHEILLGDEVPLLVVAVLAGQPGMVRLLVGAGAHPDDRTRHEVSYQTHDDTHWEDGSTALHVAARAGRLSIARFLVEHGASLDAGDLDGRTALSLAAQSGWADLVDFLLGRGARPDLEDGDHRTALDFACREGWFRIVERLRRAGAGSGPRPAGEIRWEATLVNSARLGDLEGMEEALRHGVVIGTGAGLLSVRGLLAACQHGQLAAAEFLLGRGIGATPETGWLFHPLLAAVEAGHELLVRRLLAAGARIGRSDPGGPTPVGEAAGRGLTGILRLLLESGQEIGSADRKAARARARRAGQRECLSLLRSPRSPRRKP